MFHKIPLALACSRTSFLEAGVSLDGCTVAHNALLTLLQRKEDARVAKERKELAWRRDHAYDDVMTEENLEANSNENRDEDFLDDFM